MAPPTAIDANAAASAVDTTAAPLITPAAVGAPVAKETTEWVLNQLLNRFQLNRKKRVGAVVEMINEVRPTSVEAWGQAYKERALDDDALDALGDELFSKRGVLEAEVAAMTREAARAYVRKVLFERTYNGYQAERDLVSVALARLLDLEVTHASDEWDRTYGVDLLLTLPGTPLGIQVKPASFTAGPESHLREELLRTAHARFRAEQQGEVVTIVYDKEKKQIQNPDALEALKTEVERRTAQG